ncbi:MAG: hypothetical protein IKM45_01430 [Opitutales bacterium]|nr:hypothetical protein [Opitutales bacterium]
MRVPFFDRKLVKQYFNCLSYLSLFLSLVLIFWSVPDSWKSYAAVSFVVALACAYVYLWIQANYLRKITLSINSTELQIKFGNIFKEAGLKVIAFNEYFDTRADDKIISRKTLNGVFLKEFVKDVSAVDDKIYKEMKGRAVEKNKTRSEGKKIRYKLGSIVIHDDFLLTAFSRFDECNRAFLEMEDYLRFLLFFWEEIDRVYSGNDIVVPLLGSGITRFRNHLTVTEQELLESLIWSFKISRVRLKNGAKISIVLDVSKKNRVNLFKLKEI